MDIPTSRKNRSQARPAGLPSIAPSRATSSSIMNIRQNITAVPEAEIRTVSQSLVQQGQVPQVTSEEANKAILANYVKLDSGEYVAKETFDTLPVSQQTLLRQIGVKAYNAQLAPVIVTSVAPIQYVYTGKDIGKDEFVLSSEFDKLSLENQTLLKKLGVAAYNAQAETKVNRIVPDGTTFDAQKAAQALLTDYRSRPQEYGAKVTAEDIQKVLATPNTELVTLSSGEQVAGAKVAKESANQTAILAAHDDFVKVSNTPDNELTVLSSGEKVLGTLKPETSGVYVVGNKVKLKSGEYITKNAYEGLTPEQKTIINQMSVEQFLERMRIKPPARPLPAGITTQEFQQLAANAGSLRRVIANYNPETDAKLYDIKSLKARLQVLDDVLNYYTEYQYNYWGKDFGTPLSKGDVQALLAGSTLAVALSSKDGTLNLESALKIGATEEELKNLGISSATLTTVKENIQASEDFLRDNILVGSGKDTGYVSKSEFEKLNAEQQKQLKSLGVEAFNATQNKIRQDFEANNVKLDNGEYISRDEFSELSIAQQSEIKSLGINKFNEKQKLSYESWLKTVVKLDTGEYVDKAEFNLLPKASQQELRTKGTVFFNKAQGQGTSTLRISTPKEQVSYHILDNYRVYSGKTTGVQYDTNQPGEFVGYNIQGYLWDNRKNPALAISNLAYLNFSNKQISDAAKANVEFAKVVQELFQKELAKQPKNLWQAFTGWDEAKGETWLDGVKNYFNPPSGKEKLDYYKTVKGQEELKSRYEVENSSTWNKFIKFLGSSSGGGEKIFYDKKTGKYNVIIVAGSAAPMLSPVGGIGASSSTALKIADSADDFVSYKNILGSMIDKLDDLKALLINRTSVTTGLPDIPLNMRLGSIRMPANDLSSYYQAWSVGKIQGELARPATEVVNSIIKVPALLSYIPVELVSALNNIAPQVPELQQAISSYNSNPLAGLQNVKVSPVSFSASKTQVVPIEYPDIKTISPDTYTPIQTGRTVALPSTTVSMPATSAPLVIPVDSPIVRLGQTDPELVSIGKEPYLPFIKKGTTLTGLTTEQELRNLQLKYIQSYDWPLPGWDTVAISQPIDTTIGQTQRAPTKIQTPSMQTGTYSPKVLPIIEPKKVQTITFTPFMPIYTPIYTPFIPLAPFTNPNYIPDSIKVKVEKVTGMDFDLAVSPALQGQGSITAALAKQIYGNSIEEIVESLRKQGLDEKALAIIRQVLANAIAVGSQIWIATGSKTKVGLAIKVVLVTAIQTATITQIKQALARILKTKLQVAVSVAISTAIQIQQQIAIQSQIKTQVVQLPATKVAQQVAVKTVTQPAVKPELKTVTEQKVQVGTTTPRYPKVFKPKLKYTIKNVKGAGQYPFTLKSGAFWMTVYPPFLSENDIKFTRTRPQGATGQGNSPYKTIQALGGHSVIELTLDNGIEDIVIKNPAQLPGAAGTIFYKGDRRMATKSDITIGGVNTVGQVPSYEYTMQLAAQQAEQERQRQELQRQAALVSTAQSMQPTPIVINTDQLRTIQVVKKGKGKRAHAKGQSANVPIITVARKKRRHYDSGSAFF